MTRSLAMLVILILPSWGWGANSHSRDRDEAEYYVTAYARHYGVPPAFVRSIVQQESGWHPCAISLKGAAGLMQIMPETARRLGVRNRCNIRENISGGVRYLAWLIHIFDGDLRLVAAAYYAGEHAIARRGLNYRNPDVITYVTQVRNLYEWQKSDRAFRPSPVHRTRKSQ
jgi:soluble lytic murein transglycosylase-like protein